MKQSITLTTDDTPKYLCSWNNGEIVQVHTQDTLKNDYIDTNLYDDKEENIFQCFFMAYEPLPFKKYLRKSLTNESFIGIKFYCDNMMITRIV